MKNIYFSLLFITLVLNGCGSKKNSSVSEEVIGDNEIEVSSEVSEDEIYETEENAVYRAAETIYTDLIHTKLEVNFDWTKSRMNGKAFITAKPHFYSSDSLILDAKGMDILSVKLDGKDLFYNYEDDLLKIKLGKVYKRTEKYTVEINYVAKPDERTTGGSAAIVSDKG
ncbi:MAG: M1 family aminopeptidase, partial [Bacteroidota bacterium]